jgi:hypothetical protein
MVEFIISADINITAEFSKIVSISRTGKHANAIFPLLIGNLDVTSFMNAKTITIYDMNGKARFYHKLSNGQTSVDLSDLEQGKYIVKILTNDGTFEHPVIKFDY